MILATTGTANFTIFGFYYRLCAITLNHWIFKHPYYVPMIAAAQFLLAMPINTVFFTLMWPSRTEMETCPSTSSVFKYNVILLVDSENPNFQRLMLTFNCEMALNILITAYSVTGVFRSINSNELRARMSEKTRKLNKQLTKSLIFQIVFMFSMYTFMRIPPNYNSIVVQSLVPLLLPRILSI
ncbi:unnamed protein product, partial [Mesorhabditis belari]|uniref:Uncharacterized protein n=1 Tax=Mesorhabditis belari TaxID=2138241 RepID=A0AAF3FRP1_9BILA